MRSFGSHLENEFFKCHLWKQILKRRMFFSILVSFGYWRTKDAQTESDLKVTGPTAPGLFFSAQTLDTNLLYVAWHVQQMHERQGDAKLECQQPNDLYSIPWLPWLPLLHPRVSMVTCTPSPGCLGYISFILTCHAYFYSIPIALVSFVPSPSCHGYLYSIPWFPRLPLLHLLIILFTFTPSPGCLGYLYYIPFAMVTLSPFPGCHGYPCITWRIPCWLIWSASCSTRHHRTTKMSTPPTYRL